MTFKLQSELKFMPVFVENGGCHYYKTYAKKYLSLLLSELHKNY